jgi:hypothetical protein
MPGRIGIRVQCRPFHLSIFLVAWLARTLAAFCPLLFLSQTTRNPVDTASILLGRGGRPEENLRIEYLAIYDQPCKTRRRGSTGRHLDIRLVRGSFPSSSLPPTRPNQSSDEHAPSALDRRPPVCHGSEATPASQPRSIAGTDYAE